MLPIPTGQGQTAAAAAADESDKTDKKRVDPAPKPFGNPNKFQKGNAKGKSKGKKREPIPQALKGMHSQTSR